MAQVLLLPLQVTSVAASLLVLCVQPSYALEASPARWHQPDAAENLHQAEAHNNQGVELAQQGKVPEAIAAFNRAIAIYPSYENAHNNLGLALGSQQQFSQAADAFKHALAINPNNFETYNNLGIALGSQGRFLEAVAAFEQAIQLNPKDPASHQNLGVAFWSQGKLPQATTSLQTARKLYSMQNNTDGIDRVEEILQQIESK